MTASRLRVILAAPGLAHESELVGGAAAYGLDITRRCVDTADLLASAALEARDCVVVTADLPRLTAEALDALRASGRCVIGVRVHDEPWPFASAPDMMIRAHRSAEETARAIVDAHLQFRQAGVHVPSVVHDEVTGSAGGASASVTHEAGTGGLLAVWGPAGAPGRTTVAIGLADALARTGSRVALVDADTQGPSIAFALGLREPTPGLLAACRRAENSTLTPDQVRACCRQVGRWSVLAGLDSVDRWPELRPRVVDEVWEACRGSFDITIVDVGGAIEAPADAPWSIDRHAAGRSALAQADRVVAVADASALGAARLADAWQDLLDLTPGSRRLVVRNRVRRGESAAWSSAVRCLGVDVPIHDLRERRRDLQACLSRGRSPSETPQARGWSRSMARLAREVVRD